MTLEKGQPNFEDLMRDIAILVIKYGGPEHRVVIPKIEYDEILNVLQKGHVALEKKLTDGVVELWVELS